MLLYIHNNIYSGDIVISSFLAFAGFNLGSAYIAHLTARVWLLID